METKLTKVMSTMTNDKASISGLSIQAHQHVKKSCCGDCKGNGSCRDVKINHENLKSIIDIAPDK